MFHLVRQALQGRQDGEFAYLLPVSVEDDAGGPGFGAALPPAETDGADRFFFCAAVRAGDPGHRHAEIRMAVLQGAQRHGRGHLFADGAEADNQFMGDAQLLLFGRVGVGDEPALEPFRTARHFRNCVGDAAAGAGLGRHQHFMLLHQLLAELQEQGLNPGVCHYLIHMDVQDKV